MEKNDFSPKRKKLKADIVVSVKEIGRKKWWFFIFSFYLLIKGRQIVVQNVKIQRRDFLEKQFGQ